MSPTTHRMQNKNVNKIHALILNGALTKLMCEKLRATVD